MFSPCASGMCVVWTALLPRNSAGSARFVELELVERPTGGRRHSSSWTALRYKEPGSDAGGRDSVGDGSAGENALVTAAERYYVS